MILVDTSVWVDHLRATNNRLANLLDDGEAACHPFVLGELLLGNLRANSQVPELLASLPQLVVAEHQEVVAFAEHHRLAGTGIGWVDAHLLASAALCSARLWTRDQRLGDVAARLGLSS